MATINQRTLANGRIRYWVKWRLGGTRDGAPQSEPFDVHADAYTFKLHVEAAGHLWPENWIPRKGWAQGWVPGHGWVNTDDEPEDEPVLFADFARDLIDSMSGIDERTRADYHRDLNRHLLPHFGKVNLRDTSQLKPKDVRAWVNHLQAGIPDPRTPVNPNNGKGSKKGAKRGQKNGWLRPPLAPKSIQNLHALLFTVCEAAVREDPPLRHSNPAARTRLPRVDDGEGDQEMCFLTREEFEILRDAAHADVRDMLEVFVRTGLRYSELVALQVRDITITRAVGADGTATVRGYLDVRRAWKRQSDNTFKLGPPKTRNSRRRVPLSPGTINLIQARLKGKDAEDFVFTTETGAWWRHSSFYSRRWVPAVKKARERGLAKKPRIHDLRHTHVAWLIDKDVHVFKIQRRLGHKSITTTMDRYGHLVTDIDDAIIEAIDGPPTAPAPHLDPDGGKRLRLIS
ncbi:site-specific integrase [Nocardiopsis sp. EMB25]|uniref:tyrosine-type recombinase/integrase n=1 Tax=Nocardiopsis sp. EMB25 TaxID=2835867 RepID=UPI002283BFD7|nr:site-specific integrase [Nocardiopsis sp. EMB25]MCY9786983.1 site-specific integrase [Nocardiopsis sp. EMB25]